MSNLITLREGLLIQHIKRGTAYELLGKDWVSPDSMTDDRTVKLWVSNSNLRLPVLQQVTAPTRAGWFWAWYYRALASHPGQPWLFMRPLTEFTEDRFRVLP